MKFFKSKLFRTIVGVITLVVIVGGVHLLARFISVEMAEPEYANRIDCLFDENGNALLCVDVTFQVEHAWYEYLASGFREHVKYHLNAAFVIAFVVFVSMVIWYIYCGIFRIFGFAWGTKKPDDANEDHNPTGCDIEGCGCACHAEENPDDAVTTVSQPAHNR